MSDVAREILVRGAGALGRAEGLEPSLQIILGSFTDALEIESAAILMMKHEPDRLEIVASIGLAEPTITGLTNAVSNPGHPIARTIAAPVPSFNVLPTAPGGPALRSHLPLIVRRGGTNIVLGVLALAHDRPIDAEMWPLLQAAGDLAAVAIERHQPG